jgi:hypothetical protein
MKASQAMTPLGIFRSTRSTSSPQQSELRPLPPTLSPEWLGLLRADFLNCAELSTLPTPPRPADARGGGTHGGGADRRPGRF